MTVTLGNTSSGSANSATFSWSHTVAVGSDKVLVVGLCLDSGITGSSVVFQAAGGDESFTQLRVDTNPGAARTEIWYLVNPSVETANIAVTASGKAQNIGGAADFSGAQTPDGAVGSNADSATSASDDVTTAGSDDFVFDCLRQPGSAPTIGADQASAWAVAAGGERGNGSTQPGSAGGVMSWAFSSTDYAHTACRIPSIPAVGLDQIAFRGYEDDGGEGAATAIDAQNANFGRAQDVNTRVRFEIQETGAIAEDNFAARLQYSKNGGTWTDVTASSSNVRASTSSEFTDEDATTNVLTLGTGTFEPGAMDDDNGLAGESGQIDIPASGHTEVEYCFQIRSADTVNGDDIELRVVRDGGALEIFTAVPKITIALQADDVHKTDRVTILDTQTSYTQLPGMILRPQADGDYLVVVVVQLVRETGVSAALQVNDVQLRKNSVAAGGADVASLQFDDSYNQQTGSLVAYPGIIIKVFSGLTTGDIISLAWKTNNNDDVHCTSRSIHLIPIDSGDATVKAETVLKIFDTDNAWNLITGASAANDLTIAPGAGDYIALLRVDCNRSEEDDLFVDISIFNGGSIESHTVRRLKSEGSMGDGFQLTLFAAALVTVSGSDAIEGRVRVSTGTTNAADLVQRSLILVAVSASDVVQKTATTSTVRFSPIYGTLDSMTETIDGSGDPGAGDYDVLFSCNCIGADVNISQDLETFFAMHLDGVIETDVINSMYNEDSSSVSLPYPIGVGQSHFLPIADSEVLDIRWRTDVTGGDSSSVEERTLVLWKRVAAPSVTKINICVFEALGVADRLDVAPFESEGFVDRLDVAPFEAFGIAERQDIAQFEAEGFIDRLDVAPFESEGSVDRLDVAPFEAAGTLTIIDIALFEALATIERTDIAILEALGEVNRQDIAPFEAPGFFTILAVAPFEALGVAESSDVCPFESEGIVDRIDVAPFEAEGIVDRIDIAPFESAGTLIALDVVPFEARGFFTILAIAPFEALGVADSQDVAPFEALGVAERTDVCQFESAGTLIVLVVAPFEALGVIDRIDIAPFESRGRIASIDVAPFEALGVAERTDICQFESAGTLIALTVAIFEALGVIDRIDLAPFEALGVADRQDIAPFEAEGFIDRLDVAPFESAGTLIVLTVSPFEAEGFIDRLTITPFEAKGFIDRLDVAPFEAEGFLDRLDVCQFESAGTLIVLVVAPFESLATAERTDISPYEAPGVAERQDVTPFEAEGFLDRLDVCQFESAGTLIVLTVSPFESEGLIDRLDVAPFEALGVAERTDLAPFEAAGVAERQDISPFEARGRIIGTDLEPFEAEGIVDRLNVAPFEAEGFINRLDVAPFESSGVVAVLVTVPFEAKGVVTRLVLAPFEAEGLIAVLTSAPFESAGLAVRLDVAPFESRAVADIAATFVIPFGTRGRFQIQTVVPYEVFAFLSQFVAADRTIVSLLVEIGNSIISLVTIDATQISEVMADTTQINGAENMPILLDNDNHVLLPAVKDKDGIFFTAAASITVALEELDGTVVIAARPMSFVLGSDGDFEVIYDKTELPSSTIDRATHNLHFIGSEGGKDFERFDKFFVKRRKN